MLGVRREIADVGLGVAAGSVQQHQHRLAGRRLQVAGADSGGVQVTLRERDALEITPDALELRHAGPLSSAILGFSLFVSRVCNFYARYRLKASLSGGVI